jgi:uncharacterized protein
MPANLSPEYIRLERRLRESRDPDEKLVILREMLRAIPKHKGTEKMQADLRRRISKLEQAVEQQSRKSGRDMFHVPREGAGQVVLAGPPNCGKSSILAALTNASPQVAPYPFATQHPLPGMVSCEDVQIQLVDAPPLSRDYVETALFNTYRVCDLILLVADVTDPDLPRTLADCIAMLEEHHIRIDPRAALDQDGSRSVLEKRAVIFGNKSDLIMGSTTPDDLRGRAVARLKEVLGDVRVLVGSARENDGLDRLPELLFSSLQLVRVYTKKPNQRFERGQPFVLREGATVLDAAQLIHKEFAEKLKFARLWGSGKHQGLSVPRDHVLADGDILEIHAG